MVSEAERALTRHLGFAINRASALDASWTTVHLIHAALRRRHIASVIESFDFEVDERGSVIARAFSFTPPLRGRGAVLSAEHIAEALQQRTAPRRYLRLNALDTLLLRAAPLDTQLLSFAMLAWQAGVEVVNHPSGLMLASPKTWLATLSDVPTPPTVITQSRGVATMFYDRQRKPVIVKPAAGRAGRGVSLVRPRDAEAFSEAFALARGADRHVVVQSYLREAEAGEKRVVMMDGEVLGAYLRVRAEGEFRHNLKQGGTAIATQLSATELAVLASVAPHLRDAGIRLAGIDLIGHHVVEVNVVNPGGAFHAGRLTGVDIASQIIDHLTTATSQDLPRRTPWALPVR